VKAALFGLGALAAASFALAQQATPAPETQSSPAPQEQTAPPADSTRSLSEADKQTLMNDCMRQVQAANPGVSANDVQAYCQKQVQNYSSQQSPQQSPQH
jgi:hypothetical protein